MINPLDFTGPQFLFFYFILAAGLFVLTYTVTRLRERSWEIPKINMNEAYEIAMLRAGEQEVIRVALLSLIDRGFLKHSLSGVETADLNSVNLVKRSVEKEILKFCQTNKSIYVVLTNETIQNACSVYRSNLVKWRLIVGSAVTAQRGTIVIFAQAVLLLVAGAKIFVALSRGKTNLMFLFVLTGLAVFFVNEIKKGHRTGLGDIILKDIKNLYQNLGYRANSLRPGVSTNEVSLAAAVYGVAILSPSYFPYTANLYPVEMRPNHASTSSGNDSWTSSCSSCSSCGGGGCGGGCGGCGGS